MTSTHIDHVELSLDKIPGNKARRDYVRHRIVKLVGSFLLAAFREVRS